MRFLTDDPDWAPDLYEARVLAMALLRRYGRAQPPGTPCQCCKAERGGIVVTLFPRRTPILLTIDAPDGSADLSARVLTLEYEGSSAWRIIVDVYKPGRWERQLKPMVHPPPWFDLWRALVTFTCPLPQRPPPSPPSHYLALYRHT